MSEKLTVKQWRVLKGLSQKEFSKKINMPLTTYQTKESGKREFYASEIVRIADYLNVSIDKQIKIDIKD
ncbi:helix-turn-helix domain-containing protein [Erysipelothrix anatis]|uniref:helix-turn-helix domain-containing protein n=1 Tax=Erysipelothrix anatis TaxID=2683713 RepID=UPI001357DBB8|nr:helix-turn-helix transcriptional regulator [Erysipelothrix anatis]